MNFTTYSYECMSAYKHVYVSKNCSINTNITKLFFRLSFSTFQINMNNADNESSYKKYRKTKELTIKASYKSFNDYYY